MPNKAIDPDLLLHRGDFFKLTKGMDVYTDVPAMYYFGGKRSVLNSTPVHVPVVIGTIFKMEEDTDFPLKERVISALRSVLPDNVTTSDNFQTKVGELLNSLKMDIPKTYDTSDLIGEYEVITADFEHHNTCREITGWHVCAKHCETGKKVDFYQTGEGYFSCVHPEIKATLRAK